MSEEIEFLTHIEVAELYLNQLATDPALHPLVVNENRIRCTVEDLEKDFNLWFDSWLAHHNEEWIDPPREEIFVMIRKVFDEAFGDSEDV